jgi:cell division protein FtsB
MWRVIEYIFLASIVLLAITEFFYPLLAGKKLFGTFRKRQSTTKIVTPLDTDLKSKVDEARIKVNEVKEVQNEVTEHFQEVSKLKDESDNLIK